MVFKAVEKNEQSYFYASTQLKNNRNLLLLAIKKNGNILNMAPYEFLNDFEIVLKAVSNKGFLLAILP
jgi:hypothetical protein